MRPPPRFRRIAGIGRPLVCARRSIDGTHDSNVNPAIGGCNGIGPTFGITLTVSILPQMA
jgi:hypothetical protein